MQNTQNFDEVVKMIEESNKKVDEVLKAAKLQRHDRAPMPKDRLEMIFNFILLVMIVVGVAIGVYMVIYFCGTGGR